MNFGIETDNFEAYFEKQLTGISEAGKAALPTEIALKLFRPDRSMNFQKIRSIGFLAKLWILWRCLKKRVWIVIENEDGGMTVEDFAALRESLKRRDLTAEKANDLVTQGMFVTGARELVDSLSYLNDLSGSAAYNYLVKAKNFKGTKAGKHHDEYEYVVRLLRHYEASKRKWSEAKGVTMSEFLVLLALYDKEQTNGSFIYKSLFKGSFMGGINGIKVAFGTLQLKNLIVRYGRGSGAKFRITPLGVELINSILTKYVLNC